MVLKYQAKGCKPVSLMTRSHKIGLTCVTIGDPAHQPNQDEASKRSLIYSMTSQNCWIRLRSMLCHKGSNLMRWKGSTGVTSQGWHKRILIKSTRSMFTLWFGHSNMGVTWCDTHASHKHCHSVLQKLNNLIPDFEQKTLAAENIHSFCAPVCHSWYIIMMKQQ